MHWSGLMSSRNIEKVQGQGSTQPGLWWMFVVRTTQCFTQRIGMLFVNIHGISSSDICICLHHLHLTQSFFTRAAAAIFLMVCSFDRRRTTGCLILIGWSGTTPAGVLATVLTGLLHGWITMMLLLQPPSVASSAAFSSSSLPAWVPRSLRSASSSLSPSESLCEKFGPFGGGGCDAGWLTHSGAGTPRGAAKWGLELWCDPQVRLHGWTLEWSPITKKTWPMETHWSPRDTTFAMGAASVNWLGRPMMPNIAARLS